MTVTSLSRGTEPPAFDDFFRSYYVRVLVLMRRHFPRCDAEEIAQETMARCYTSYATLDHNRDPWPWVNSVARNAAIDSMRRNRRNVPSDEVPEVERGDSDATYDAVLVAERRRSVRTALKQLHPSDRQLVEDHDLEGMAYTEMAALRDITPNALRQRLFRARHRLALELRRVGATLGVVPVALHSRYERTFRRAGDYSYAAGAAGVSAISIAAVAGVAGVVTVLAGPATPVAMASNVQAVVEPADRALAAQAAAARLATAATTQPPSVVRPSVVRPSVGPPPVGTIPITYEQTGDPTKGAYSHKIVVDTPVAHPQQESHWEALPGQGVICWLELPGCLDPGSESGREKPGQQQVPFAAKP